MLQQHRFSDASMTPCFCRHAHPKQGENAGPSPPLQAFSKVTPGIVMMISTREQIALTLLCTH